jgi:acyl-CoA dehydrogenase
VSIITGGASGIGRALALELGRRGAIVVVSDVNLDGAQAVAAAINAMRPDSATAVALDVADAEAVARAAGLYDAGKPCGAEANAAKYLAAEAGFEACTQAVMTHGGYGYAKEYHVERYMREVMIPRIAPVSREMILCFIAEKVLGLPKSY